MARVMVRRIDDIRRCQSLIITALEATGLRPDVVQCARKCLNNISFYSPNVQLCDVSWNEMIAACLSGVDYTFVLTFYESGTMNGEIVNRTGPREEGVIAVYLLPIFGIVRALFDADERTQMPSRLH
jgi:hypothetical protein